MRAKQKRQGIFQRKIQRPQGEKAPFRSHKKAEATTTIKRVKVGKKKRVKRYLEVSVPQGVHILHTTVNFLPYIVGMRMFKRADCIVYDKDMKPIAIIDAVTKERRPYGTSA